MAVIVDTTNIIRAGFDLRSLAITLLGALARDRGHALIMPDVVVEELRSRRLEGVRKDIQNLKSALSRVRGFHEIPQIALPDEQSVLEQWIAQLRQTFEVVEMSGDEARAALFREAHGHPPASQKEGSRDAAIWEVTKRIHLQGDSQTYFVSHNFRDFGDPKEPTMLHKDLQIELGADAGRFTYLHAVDDVLAALGNRVDRELTVMRLDEMNDSGVLSSVVAGWIQLNFGRKAFDQWRELSLQNPPSSISIRVGEALPAALQTSETYEVEGSYVTVAETTFQISYQVHFIGSEADIRWFGVAGDLNVQLLLRETPEGEVSAEVLRTTDKTLRPFLPR